MSCSQWLDEHREIIGLVAEDLRRHGVKETGRQGLPAESVLRCALLKQHRQLSYEELAFHLEDSASFRAFARLPLSWTPKKSVLQKTTSAVRAETWEAINRVLLVSARQAKVETGKVVRLDSTVTAALLHEPSDSSLLWDAVRVMVRLLRSAETLIAGRLVWRDHRRAAKKRARAIEYTRARPNRVPHYRELIKLTRATLAHVDQAAAQVSQAPDPVMAAPWQAEFRHYRPLIERIIRQTERRVLHGETVAASEKIVSLFEPHADIIVKGSRKVEYGHKLNLTTGRSGLILDLVVEAGNPADSERFLPMLERHIAFYGEAPRQASGWRRASSSGRRSSKAASASFTPNHKLFDWTKHSLHPRRTHLGLIEAPIMATMSRGDRLAHLRRTLLALVEAPRRPAWRAARPRHPRLMRGIREVPASASIEASG